MSLRVGSLLSLSSMRCGSLEWAAPGGWLGSAPPLGQGNGQGLTPTAGSAIRKATTFPPQCSIENGPCRDGVTQAPQRVVDPVGAVEDPAGLNAPCLYARA